MILPSGERAASVSCSRDKAESRVVAHQEASESFEGRGIKIAMQMMFFTNLKDRRHHLPR